jgi:toxin ParE1/3/4
MALKAAIQKGLDSPRVENFDFDENLKRLKAEKKKMAKVILRKEAIDDLNDIWIYTFEEWSEKQADKYYATLKFTCSQIGKNPQPGKEYEGVGRNLLGLRAGKHIVFYKIIN